jgi:undecaprenyl-diphosphatase
MFRSEKVPLFRLPRIHLDVSKCEKRSVEALEQNAPSGTGRAAKALGWACDARTLLSAGAIWWLVSPPGKRQTSLRYLAVFATTTILHHAVKKVVDQQRPDRVIRAPVKHRLIGRASDAFPSGHAMHAGALASFLAGSGNSSPPWLWSACGALALSRVPALAHWPSGVAAGFAAGAIIERSWRRIRPLQ